MCDVKEHVTNFIVLGFFRTSKIEGSITMNGKERNISLFRKLSAYIMQDNQLHANLTVEEAMNVAANLKLSQKVMRGEKLNVVSVKLDDFCNYITPATFTYVIE